MKEDVPFQQFQLQGQVEELFSIGSGHINDTYLIRCNDAGRQIGYVVQRINHQVFIDPPAVMENMLRVTRHLQGKVCHLPDWHRRVLRVVPALDGKSWYRDPGGNYWRCCFHITDASSLDLLETPEQAWQAAFAYGHFQQMLLDLEGPPLQDTIAQFHSGSRRLRDLESAIRADPLKRAAAAEGSIRFALERSGAFSHLETLAAQGKLPHRITHNDTKVNNVLLDDHRGEGICVIDLDTVMTGLTLYDFGDLVRSGATTCHEDERDLGKVGFNEPIFEALLSGYLKGTGPFLVAAERENLYFSGVLMTLIVGTRFLTDHLLGDQYFKIQRPNQNLDRARAHFALVASMEQRRDDMENLVHRICLEILGPTREGT